jgi:hypothetical protein
MTATQTAFTNSQSKFIEWLGSEHFPIMRSPEPGRDWAIATLRLHFPDTASVPGHVILHQCWFEDWIDLTFLAVDCGEGCLLVPLRAVRDLLGTGLLQATGFGDSGEARQCSVPVDRLRSLPSVAVIIWNARERKSLS